jgi:hypothetical protein
MTTFVVVKRLKLRQKKTVAQEDVLAEIERLPLSQGSELLVTKPRRSRYYCTDLNTQQEIGRSNMKGMLDKLLLVYLGRSGPDRINDVDRTARAMKSVGGVLPLQEPLSTKERTRNSLLQRQPQEAFRLASW